MIRTEDNNNVVGFPGRFQRLEDFADLNIDDLQIYRICLKVVALKLKGPV